MLYKDEDSIAIIEDNLIMTNTIPSQVNPQTNTANVRVRKNLIYYLIASIPTGTKIPTLDDTSVVSSITIESLLSH